jgi:pimeloyl-ACP methyl ester carboxylesterase
LGVVGQEFEAFASHGFTFFAPLSVAQTVVVGRSFPGEEVLATALIYPTPGMVKAICGHHARIFTSSLAF